MIETYRGVVYPRELDHMGHMNVQWYTSKFDQATWHLFSYVGITSEYIKEDNKGMAALEQITKYKAEVMAGDLLVVRTKVLGVSNKTIRAHHVMTNVANEIEVATNEIVAAHIDREIRKSCALPDHVKVKCEELIQTNV